ncbi:hypothetical protein GLOIN_2v1797848 [Rhizophagus irregularis DAOM 181602=DAOM 197198]|nr:hypothetical protein GLOIN_2v1797848 [Rhizophagus irregularis DAOM 181602=DAOM 197198]
MFCTAGCTNITPRDKEISNITNSEKDRETIANLYMEGFLNITIPSPADVFWNCFHDSYNANPNGIDGKIHILSIIGESFIYKDMIDELEPFLLLILAKKFLKLVSSLSMSTKSADNEHKYGFV